MHEITSHAMTPAGAADLTGLILRRITPDDSLALARLRVASFAELGLIEPQRADAFERRATREFFQLWRAGGIDGWVAECSGEIVASAYAVFWQRLPYPGSSRHAEIAGVYVQPAYRGRGIASELVREAVAAAAAMGVRKIVLHPTERSRALYEKCGFKNGSEMVLAAHFDKLRVTPDKLKVAE
jgi:ribosomal protein S18 acetylase RimI-like enzyme